MIIQEDQFITRAGRASETIMIHIGGGLPHFPRKTNVWIRDLIGRTILTPRDLRRSIFRGLGNTDAAQTPPGSGGWRLAFLRSVRGLILTRPSALILARPSALILAWPQATILAPLAPILARPSALILTRPQATILARPSALILTRPQATILAPLAPILVFNLIIASPAPLALILKRTTAPLALILKRTTAPLALILKRTTAPLALILKTRLAGSECHAGSECMETNGRES